MPTILEICTEALEDIEGFVIPTLIFGNTDDDTAKQLAAISKKVGREMMRDHDFQELDASDTITTQANVATYSLPDDYDRLIPQTMWDQTLNRRMVGAVTPMQWARATNRLVQLSFRHDWRVRGNKIELYPTPTAAFAFDFEYKSAFYAMDANGTAKREFSADNDTPVLPYDLFIAGVKYYFSKGNDLAYEDLENEYNQIIARREGTSKPTGVINMAARTPMSRGYYSDCLNFPDKITV